MKNKRYKPLFDKLYWLIMIPTALLTLSLLVISLAFEPTMLFLSIPLVLFVFYFLISPVFGYVELREKSVFIKYGLILKKEIAYDHIRAVEKGRRFYSESMMSLKNAFEHVNIKYNTFDVTTVSVVGNDDFAEALVRCCHD